MKKATALAIPVSLGTMKQHDEMNRSNKTTVQQTTFHDIQQVKGRHTGSFSLLKGYWFGVEEDRRNLKAVVPTPAAAAAPSRRTGRLAFRK